MKNIAIGFALATLLLAACGEKSTPAADPGTVATPAGSSVRVQSSESKIGWLGKKIGMYDHTGTIGIKEGQFHLKDGKVMSGYLVIDMNTIDATIDDVLAPEGKKDYFLGHLKSADFFEVDKYPVSTFNITKIEPAANDTFQVSGNLKIKDAEKEITFPALIKIENGKLSASGAFVVNRADFNVKWGSKSFPDMIVNDIIIDDQIAFDFSLVAL